MDFSVRFIYFLTYFAPEAHGLPKVVVAPEVPKVPAASESTEAPDLPKVAEEPKAPMLPEAPNLPKAYTHSRFFLGEFHMGVS